MKREDVERVIDTYAVKENLIPILFEKKRHKLFGPDDRKLMRDYIYETYLDPMELDIFTVNTIKDRVEYFMKKSNSINYELGYMKIFQLIKSYNAFSINASINEKSNIKKELIDDVDNVWYIYHTDGLHTNSITIS